MFPRRAGIPREAGQQGLGLVVTGVGGGDQRRAPRFGRALQEVIAQRARGLLEPEAFGRGPCGHVAVLDHTGDAALPAEAFHKGRVAQRFFAADAVLVMRGAHAAAERGEQMQQTHGVGPAGDGTDHAGRVSKLPGKVNIHRLSAFQRG